MYQTTDEIKEIRPQAGRQTEFLTSPADIVIYGGAAGGGKTWGLLLDPLRHIQVEGFGGTIFRRTYPEITNEGGLWEEAQNLYPYAGGQPIEGKLMFVFPPYGNKIRFRHLQLDKDLAKYLGAQICYMGFDQLETFTAKQFFYMVTRNRSVSGVRPYIRATCNPDPESFVADFISWWIADDGYADLARAGVIRWFVQDSDNNIVWGDSEEEMLERFPQVVDGQRVHIPLSVTYIPATVYDNKKLLDKDPAYLSKLMNTTFIDRERLLGDPKRGGNWKIKPEAGLVFNRYWFDIIEREEVPHGGLEGRGEDFAATLKDLKNKDPDFYCSIRMKRVNDIYYITDMEHLRLSAGEVLGYSKQTVKQDWQLTNAARYGLIWEQEGGSQAKILTENRRREFKKEIPDLYCDGRTSHGDKLSRWKLFAAAAAAGKVKIIRAPWTEELLSNLHGQPDLPHDDVPDAASVIYNWLHEQKEPEISTRSEEVSPTFAILNRR